MTAIEALKLSSEIDHVFTPAIEAFSISECVHYFRDNAGDFSIRDIKCGYVPQGNVCLFLRLAFLPGGNTWERAGILADCWQAAMQIADVELLETSATSDLVFSINPKTQ